jgi:hypothetical protein
MTTTRNHHGELSEETKIRFAILNQSYSEFNQALVYQLIANDQHTCPQDDPQPAPCRVAEKKRMM